MIVLSTQSFQAKEYKPDTEESTSHDRCVIGRPVWPLDRGPTKVQVPEKDSDQVAGHELVLERLVVHLVVVVIMVVIEVDAKEKCRRDMVIKSPPRSQGRRWPSGSDGLSPAEAPTSPQLPRCASPGR